MVEDEGSNGNPAGALVHLVECETGLDPTNAWRLCELAGRSENCRMCEDLGERNGEPCSCLAGSMVALGREVDAAIEADDAERDIAAVVGLTAGGHLCEHTYNRCQYEDADGVTRCAYAVTEERG